MKQHRPVPSAPDETTTDRVSDLFDRGPNALGGRAGALPYRSELEARYGEDLGDVEVVLGAGSVLGQIMASAATDGETIAFADTSPDLYTVAHELAHVLQHRSGGGAPTGLDSAGGSAE